MGIFDFFSKKSNPIDRDALVPHLTKSVIELFITDEQDDEMANFLYLDIDIRFEYCYWIAPDLSYRRNDKYYGWICVLDPYEKFMTSLYLVTTLNNSEKYRTLFYFTYDDFKIDNVSFENVRIPDHDNGLEKCLRAIRNRANLNNYHNPPPYVVFASMI